MGGRSRFATSAFVMDYTNLQVQTPIGIGVFDIRNAAAATIRGIEVEGTSLIGHGIQAGGHLAWLDATYDRYIAVAVEGTTGDVSGNRLNNAPEWAGRLWIEWGDIGPSRRLSISGESTASRRCSIRRQRRHPATEPVRPAWRPHRIRPWPIAGGLSARTRETSRTRLRHGNFRHAAQRICRTSWAFASVRDRFHAAPVGAQFSELAELTGLKRRNEQRRRVACTALARWSSSGGPGS